MFISCKISTKPFPGLRAKTFAALFFVTLAIEKPFAQVTDDFSDGDFMTNPAWNGTTEGFTVNSASQLQLNSSIAGSSYLYVELPLTDPPDFEWKFYVKQSFAPSGGNFGRFYLMSDQADLRGPLNGYYLQFGEAGSLDAVELFRQSGSTRVSVCRATNAAIASAFAIRVKVLRSADGLWQLFADYAAGTDFIPEASGMDTTYSALLYSGMLCTYTITNATSFYYDDISMQVVNLPDTTPPEIISLKATSDQSLEIIFSEALDSLPAEDPVNYHCTSTLGYPQSAVLLSDRKTVQLFFADAFKNGETATIQVKDIRDLAGNLITTTEKEFLYFKPEPVLFRDVILTEIFPDPAPQIGLPSAEYVELYNRSINPVQLDGWSFSDGSSTGKFSSFILLPGRYLIVCPSTSVSEFTGLGNTLSPSNFPTLNNASDHLKLRDPDGVLIDSVDYSDAWYRDVDKKEGGWSLERMDPEDACEDEANWMASADPAGGTPGRQNSVYEVTPDNEGPKLIEALQISGTVVQLVFDEKLAGVVPDASDFSVRPFAEIVSVSFPEGSLSKIDLEFAQAIDTLTSYTFEVTNIYDCPGNGIQPAYNTAYLNQDLTPPKLISAEATSSSTVLITFSEKLSAASAQATSNYLIEAWGNPASVLLLEDERSLILSYTTPFANGYERLLTVKGITDLSGNMLHVASVNFLYFKAAPVQYKDVIFTEICADPTPPIALPEAEFIEIYNRSENPIDLSGWTVSDETTFGLCESFILQPLEYLIICAEPARTRFASFGNVISVTPFPSLNNSGDLVRLRDREGRTIDSLQYDLSWYRDQESADGGWSLEIIDPENICEGKSNWTTAEDASGGTPGKQNSVYATKPDNSGPKLISVYPLDTTALTVVFDERLESAVPGIEKFSIEPKLPVKKVIFSDASLTRLTLFLSGNIEASKNYRLFVKDIYDCPGNKIDEGFSQGLFVLPEKAMPGDISVNEILFNPRPTGVDFVEIYNRSGKAIDLGSWSIRNSGTSAGEGASVISKNGLLIYPGEFRVFTENTNVLKGEYLLGVEENFVQMNLPALNDDDGSVTIMNEEGTVIDSVYYNVEMHSPFVQNTEGISLERISADSQENHPSNWRSASSASGFATPGYVNSNVRREGFAGGAIMIEPQILQPDVSPHDFAQIKYHFDQGGFMANVIIFDQAGRTIRELARNELLGTEGFFRWDADQDNGSRVRTGYYLVWFEIFDSSGIVKTFKERVAVY